MNIKFTYLILSLSLLLNIYLSILLVWNMQSSKIDSKFMSKDSIKTAQEYEDFYKFPLSQKVSDASVIAEAKHEYKDGNVVNRIINILKKSPNAKFPYKIGDVYPVFKKATNPSTDYGDGEILFFIGDDAVFLYSIAYSANSLRGEEPLSLDQFRALVKERSE